MKHYVFITLQVYRLFQVSPSSVLKHYEQLQNISKYSFVKINVLTCIN